MQPTLFISHGSPMLALEEEPTAKFLQNLSSKLPTPQAIIVASAHWETNEPQITGAAQPATIHDFKGFPKALYDLRYPSPGAPQLAARIESLLKAVGFNASIDYSRGLDHGVWNPLLLMYPDAAIPVVELSIQPHRDARWHYKLGQALSALRAENILIIGTGNLTHNLYQAMRGNHHTVPSWVTAFAEWVAKCMSDNDLESLFEWERLAPYAKENHPTAEHFLPLFVALGAANTPLNAQRLHSDITLGVLAMDAYKFGAQ